MGWYRTTFVVDSLQATDWILRVNVHGAAEFYLDGGLVGSRGKWAASHEDEEWSSTLDEGIPIDLEPGEHVLSVRYSSHAVKPWLRLLFGTSMMMNEIIHPGPNASLQLESAWVVEKNDSDGPVPWIIGLLGGALLAIGLFGLILRFLSGGGRELLHLSLQPLLLGAAMIVAALLAKGMWGLFGAVLFSFAVSPLLFGSFISMGVAIVEAYAVRWKSLMLRAAAFSMGTMVLSSAFMTPWIWLPTLACYVAFLIAALILLIQAALQNQRGAWVLCAGFVFSVSGIVINRIDPSSDFLTLSFIAFPLAVSYYFGVRFSASVQESQDRLEENNRLILEKQQLVEGQKEELERTVEARTAELKASQAQLVEQEKLASLGSLTAGIAHEIKNPLNFVNNFAEVGGELADELAQAIAAGNTEEAQQILDELKANATQIAKHGKRADSIVQGMMQHARGGASEQETIVVNDFLEEYANLAWHGMRARDHGFQAEIKREFDPSAGSLQVMPQELGRVVLNLLNNAFDAIKALEGAAVTVGSQRSDEGVTITVSDNGPGIPEDIRQKIFEPFFTTKATGEGTGLGLSLSYDIVTKGHGGTMMVGSSDEGGAQFTITLPGGAA